MCDTGGEKSMRTGKGKKEKKKPQPLVLASAFEPSHITLGLSLRNNMATKRLITALIRRQGKEFALLISRACIEALGDTVGLSDKFLVS